MNISSKNTTFLKRTFEGDDIYFIANLSNEPELISNVAGDFSSLNTGKTLKFNKGLKIKPWEYHFLLKN
ncbi:MAG: hypothetical protein ACJ0OB_05505 [Flavobacteriaceae bacterium]